MAQHALQDFKMCFKDLRRFKVSSFWDYRSQGAIDLSVLRACHGSCGLNTLPTIPSTPVSIYAVLRLHVYEVCAYIYQPMYIYTYEYIHVWIDIRRLVYISYVP